MFLVSTIVVDNCSDSNARRWRDRVWMDRSFVQGWEYRKTDADWQRLIEADKDAWSTTMIIEWKLRKEKKQGTWSSTIPSLSMKIVLFQMRLKIDFHQSDLSSPDRRRKGIVFYWHFSFHTNNRCSRTAAIGGRIPLARSLSFSRTVIVYVIIISNR